MEFSNESSVVEQAAVNPLLPQEQAETSNAPIRWWDQYALAWAGYDMSDVPINTNWKKRLENFQGGCKSDNQVCPPGNPMETCPPGFGYEGSTLKQREWLFINQDKIHKQIRDRYTKYLNDNNTFYDHEPSHKEIYELGKTLKIPYSVDIYYDHQQEKFLPKSMKPPSENSEDEIDPEQLENEDEQLSMQEEFSVWEQNTSEDEEESRERMPTEGVEVLNLSMEELGPTSSNSAQRQSPSANSPIAPMIKADPDLPIQLWYTKIRNRYMQYGCKMKDTKNPFLNFDENSVPHFEGIPANAIEPNTSLNECSDWQGPTRTKEYRHWGLAARISQPLPAKMWIRILGLQIPPNIWKVLEGINISSLSVLFTLKRAVSAFEKEKDEHLVRIFDMCDEANLKGLGLALRRNRYQFVTSKPSQTHRKESTQEVLSAWFQANRSAREELLEDSNVDENFTPIINQGPKCDLEEIDEYTRGIGQLIAQQIGLNRLFIGKQTNSELKEISAKYVLFIEDREAEDIKQKSLRFDTQTIGMKDRGTLSNFFKNHILEISTKAVILWIVDDSTSLASGVQPAAEMLEEANDRGLAFYVFARLRGTRFSQAFSLIFDKLETERS